MALVESRVVERQSARGDVTIPHQAVPEWYCKNLKRVVKRNGKIDSRKQDVKACKEQMDRLELNPKASHDPLFVDIFVPKPIVLKRTTEDISNAPVIVWLGSIGSFT